MWLTKFFQYQFQTRKLDRHASYFWEWHGDVIDAVEDMIDIDRSDAQGLVEVNFDKVTDGWDADLSAKDVAAQIVVSDVTS